MGCFSLLLLPAPPAVWWWSAGLGIGIGLLYSLASLVTNRIALRQEQHLFMVIVLGGMVVRMMAALLAVVLILWLLPVEQAVFIGSFLGVFIIGMVMEVWSLHRRLLKKRDP